MSVTLVKSGWSSGCLVFEQVSSSGAIHFGVDDTGLDIKFFGATSGAYMLWDESADALVFAGLAKIDIGSSGTPLVLTAGTPVLDFYTTCASTSESTSAQPVVFNTVMTGIGGVGGRVRVNMETNVALGGWANAFKASVDCKTNGYATGLLSVICAELTLPAGVGGGTTGILELEAVCPASWVGTSPVSLIYFNATGATIANFDTYGYLFDINGVSSGSGKLYDLTASAATGDETLRIRINGVNKYLLVAADPN